MDDLGDDYDGIDDTSSEEELTAQGASIRGYLVDEDEFDDMKRLFIDLCSAVLLNNWPGCRVTKQIDPYTKQRSLLFKFDYPEIEGIAKPRHRFISSYEQRVQPFDKRYQYLLFAAEPYETISFKVPSTEHVCSKVFLAVNFRVEGLHPTQRGQRNGSLEPKRCFDGLAMNNVGI
ncbi:hypothetical protein P8452_73457 [Trifolium repens]|nr:hypothetical protein P8452_73457 [Trifolium repens]